MPRLLLILYLRNKRDVTTVLYYNNSYLTYPANPTPSTIFHLHFFLHAGHVDNPLLLPLSELNLDNKSAPHGH